MSAIQRLILCTFCAWPALSAGTSITPRADELVAKFVAAWNAHDATAFGALMKDDADWVTASGIRLLGRKDIQAYLAEEHATWAKTTTMVSKTLRVRSLDSRTAVVMFEWEIHTPGVAGAAPSVARGNNLFVAVDSNGWQIVSGQVARARTQ